MSVIKNIRFFIASLLLLLSFVAFDSFSQQPSNQGTYKTTLVVNNVEPSKRFCIALNKANKLIEATFFFQPKFSFNTFIKIQESNDFVSFSRYSSLTQLEITKRLQKEIFSPLKNKLVYEDSIV